MRSYIELSAADQERLRAELAKEANKEVREMVITWEESLAESEARGRAEGEAKGVAKGEAKATRETIVLLLERRGIPVSPGVVEKLEAIEDLARLHELLEQAVDARSIDDLDL